MPDTGGVTIDVTIASAAWRRALKGPAGLCRRAVRAALADAPPRRRPRARALEVAVVLTSDKAIRALNATYRGHDKPTNVLAFPADQGDPGHGQPITLGDIVVAYGTCAREAKGDGKALSAHVTHLVVHGLLHLLGYDHHRAGEARTMERLEISVLRGLGIANPYEPRAARAKPTTRARRPRKKRAKQSRSKGRP